MAAQSNGRQQQSVQPYAAVARPVLLVPCAGKTYVGIQIIKLLIANTANSHRDAARGRHPRQPAAAAETRGGGKPDIGPILACCYTNHAIDRCA